MTIAHDSEVFGAAHSTAGAYTTAITPTNPPAGVCVIIVQGGVVTDLVTSVTYGGVLLTRRRFDTEATEAGGVYIYWGAGTLPTGVQNVVVNRTGTANLRAMISTMTVAAGRIVAIDTDAVGSSAAIVNPSWTLTTAADPNACYLGIHSGLQTMTTTPATNWTLQGSDDIGNTGRGWARRIMTPPGNAAPGWTAATSEDYVGSAVAFKETTPQQNVTEPVFPAVMGRPNTPSRQTPTIY
jgi:hypothetical protein